MKNYLLILLLLLFNGCVMKDDYMLFSKASIDKGSPTVTEENQRYNPREYRENRVRVERTQVTRQQLPQMQFEYKILPHDRLSVIVYKHPELSTIGGNRQNERGLLVNSQGYLRLPLIKRVHLAGLTQTQAEDKISQAFAHYLKHPDVQLEVLNKRAYIIGEVRAPGELELQNERVTLFQFLARSGGLTDTADRKSIMIMRNSGYSNVETEVVNLTDVNSLRTANLMIHPNDIVYVMPNKMKGFNTRVNQINPLFNLLGNILQPFVNIKVLTN